MKSKSKPPLEKGKVYSHEGNNFIEVGRVVGKPEKDIVSNQMFGMDYSELPDENQKEVMERMKSEKRVEGEVSPSESLSKEICICGHKRTTHFWIKPNVRSYCESIKCNCKEFKPSAQTSKKEESDSLSQLSQRNTETSNGKDLDIPQQKSSDEICGDGLKIKFDRPWFKLKNRAIGDIFSTYRKFFHPKLNYYLEALLGNNFFDVLITNTRNGFKGFSKGVYYIKLDFEVVGTRDDLVSKANLCGLKIVNEKDITKEEREIDTKE